MQNRIIAQGVRTFVTTLAVMVTVAHVTVDGIAKLIAPAAPHPVAGRIVALLSVPELLAAVLIAPVNLSATTDSHRTTSRARILRKIATAPPVHVATTVAPCCVLVQYAKIVGGYAMTMVSVTAPGSSK